MATQKEPSTAIKVTLDANGAVVVGHSDAYLAMRERFENGGHFSAKERAAAGKLIEAEEAGMQAAQKNPQTYLQSADSDMQQHKPAAAIAPQPVAPAEPVQQERLTVAEAVKRAEQAFAEATPEDRAVAMKNLEGIQKQLQSVPYMTPDFLLHAQQKAFVDEGQKLRERNLAANRNANALTYEVANFSQGRGKTMLNVDAVTNVRSGEVGYAADVHHGLNGKLVGLDLAEVNAGAAYGSNGAVDASVGLRGVKQLYADGDHKVFAAAALDAKVAGVNTDTPQLGGSATGLVVNTHTLAGRPTSEIGGAVVDMSTGATTLVGTVSQTFNADTKYATTARAVGTYAVEPGSGGFSLEVYQRTGVAGLTARLSAGVQDVGGKNDVAVDAGVSLGF